MIDHEQIIKSNRDVNLEELMKLRYSSDATMPKDNTNGSKLSDSRNVCGNGTVSLGNSSMNTIERKDLVNKLVSGTDKNSYNSSEYL